MKGSVVLVPFPFSNLAESKKRPVLVLEKCEAVVLTDKVQGAVVCQITSQDYHSNGIKITNADFESGSLDKISYVVPSMIFTIKTELILRHLAKLKKDKHSEIVNKIIDSIKI